MNVASVTETDHSLALRIAEEAGVGLVELRGRLWHDGAPSWQIMDAGDASAHRYLVDALHAARPGDSVLSEEGRDDRRRLQAQRVWIIDPLDGTNEYGEPDRSDWAVHVALWEQGELVAGAVALPALGISFGTDPAPVVPPNERGPILDKNQPHI